MRTVTALRAERRGRVAVELDGAPWRTLPLEPVVRAGLAVGSPLDRARARALARELRRARALATATRALRRRDHARAELDGKLAARGIAPAGRAEALAALERARLLEDGRFAAGRAEALAARGYGDAAIRADLEARGVDAEAIGDALAGLAPEPERAEAAAGGRTGAAAARYLSRRGFGEDALEALVGASGEEWA